MASFDALTEVFRRLHGKWALSEGQGGDFRAERSEDGLTLSIRLVGDDVLMVEPVLPRTGTRRATPDDWHDIHQGEMPKPARLRLSLGVDHVAERLSRGLLLEAEALHRVTAEVTRIEEEPLRQARDLIAHLEQSTGFARRLERDQEQMAEFRLYSPFAGEVTVKRDGNVRFMLQDVPAHLAANLLRWMAEAAASAERTSLPRYEPPKDVVRRGPANSHGGMRMAVLRAFQETPGASQTTVASLLGISRQAVNQHVKALRSEGLLPEESREAAGP